MLSVPEEIKQLYKEDGIYKNIRISFPNGEHEDICNDQIEINSVSFTESLCSQNEFKLGLTEIPVFEADVHINYNPVGCTIFVANEIDCTSLGEEWCRINAEYKSDLGRYVYSIPYGLFDIYSATKDEKAEKRSIEAYGLGIDYERTTSPMFKLMSEKTAYSTMDVGPYAYSVLTSIMCRYIKNVWEGKGTIINNLVRKNYSYDLTDGYSLQVVYDALDNSFFIRNGQPSGLAYDGNIAILDYDKSKRINAFNSFLEKMKSKISRTALNTFNVISNDEFIKSLHNPRYTLAYYYGFVINSGYPDYNFVDFCIDKREFVTLNEFLPCEGYEFLTHILPIKSNSIALYSYANNPALENVLNENNIPCTHGRLYIPTKLNLLHNGKIIDSVDFDYTRLHFEKYTFQNTSIGLFYGGNARYEMTKGLRRNYTSSGKSVYFTGTVNPSQTYTFYEYDDLEWTDNDFTTMIRDTLECMGSSAVVSRDGSFKAVSTAEMFNALYPSETLYPEEELFPMEGDVILTPTNYIEVKHGEQIEKPYGKIVWKTLYRNLYDDVDLYPNKYKVYDISNNSLLDTANAPNYDLVFDFIEAALKNVIYMPCDLDMIALPYLEAGDVIEVITNDGGFQTLINRRTISGEQHLVDNIEVQ